MNRLKVRVDFEIFFTISRLGRSGGLAILWKEEVGLEVKNYSQLDIDVHITSKGGEVWWPIGFYGHPDSKKEERILSFAKSPPWDRYSSS